MKANSLQKQSNKILCLQVSLKCRHNDSLIYQNINSGIYNIIGRRVIVPLGNRKVCAYIIKIIEVDINELKYKLKKIYKILDKNPILSTQQINFFNFTAKYYHCSLYEIIKIALPSNINKGYSFDFDQKQYKILKTIDFININSIPKSHKIKIKLYTFLKEQIKNNNLILTEKDFIKNNLKTKDIQSAVFKKVIIENPMVFIKNNISKQIINKNISYELNSQQLESCEIISKSLNKYDDNNIFLLYGITGSGKTEVYFQLIQKALLKNQQILFLIPEIGLTPQTYQRLQERFSVKISVINSTITNNQQTKTWIQAQSGAIKIILSTRSGVFTGFKNLGLIIIDEEHDKSFKQYEKLRYNAKNIALMRSKFEKCTIVLGTATPSLSSYYNTINKKFTLLELNYRANNSLLPKIKLIDTSIYKEINGISNVLLIKIKEVLKNGNQVLLFLNRRGFSPIYMCHDCKWTAKCKACEKNYTLHLASNKLICHFCNSSIDIPMFCIKCNSINCTPVGVGTERVESYLQSIFPDNNILRVDKTNISKKNDMENSLELINNNKVDIIIATQMLAKGHHFPNVTLVGILNIDNGLYSADFDSLELTGQMITQISGRAGREIKKGIVYLQTKIPNHPLFKYMIKNKYLDFLNTILKDRKLTNFTPYSFISYIYVDSKKIEDSEQLLYKTKNYVITHDNTSEISNPVPSVDFKRNNLYKMVIMIKNKNRKGLHFSVFLAKFYLDNINTKSLKYHIDLD